MLTNETRMVLLEALELLQQRAGYHEYLDNGDHRFTLDDAKSAAIDAAIAEVNAAAQKTPQPDWSKAPEWARWWAMDADGAPYWFEEKPERHLSTWQAVTGRYEESDRKPDVDWGTTLCERTGSQEATDGS